MRLMGLFSRLKGFVNLKVGDICVLNNVIAKVREICQVKSTG